MAMTTSRNHPATIVRRSGKSTSVSLANVVGLLCIVTIWFVGLGSSSFFQGDYVDLSTLTFLLKDTDNNQQQHQLLQQDTSFKNATSAVLPDHTSSWIPRTSAHKCTQKPDLAPYYKSQAGEDKILLKWLGDLCGGTYLEMGALDGVMFSNSHVFHKGLNWTGVLIEASPRHFANLQANRPHEIALVHSGICHDTRQLHWVEGRGPATGAFLEFSAETHRRKWFTKEHLAQAQVVQCRPLRHVLHDTVGDYAHFDFFSLDVEGAELSVLQSIDFSKVAFGIILVESNPYNELKNLATRSVLEANDYIFLQAQARSFWFVHKHFGEMYKDVIYEMDTAAAES